MRVIKTKKYGTWYIIIFPPVDSLAVWAGSVAQLGAPHYGTTVLLSHSAEEQTEQCIRRTKSNNMGVLSYQSCSPNLVFMWVFTRTLMKPSAFCERHLWSFQRCTAFLVALACFTSRATLPVTTACVCVLVCLCACELVCLCACELVCLWTFSFNFWQ